mmetsp:Transcript_2712/g.4388  ORF Transcript_2712/g.4388 Transcript_2712/m.4388 type:complete len:206 (+) Transcript_2712:351-968(+)
MFSGSKLVLTNGDRFQEMQFLHIRSLQGDSYGGASLQNPGMSLQIPGGMGSLQTFPPTFPATTMSIDIPAQPVSTTPPSTITESSTCITPDLTNSSSVDIVFLLEVETLSGGTAFVDDLAQGMVSSLAASFSLCIPSGNRKLVARNLEESEVTGLKVSDKTGIDESKFTQQHHTDIFSLAKFSYLTCCIFIFRDLHRDDQRSVIV